jgi:hypothetical protein
MGLVATSVASSILLDALFGDGHDTDAPESYWLALSTTAPELAEETGAITNVTELGSGLGYARAELPNDDATWDITARVASNKIVVEWTATDDAETPPAHWVLYSAETGGTAIIAGALTGAIYWVDEATIQIAVGALTVTVAAA